MQSQFTWSYKRTKKILTKTPLYITIYILEWLITLKKLYRHSICITEAWLLLWKNNIIFRNSQDEKTKQKQIDRQFDGKIEKIEHTLLSVALVWKNGYPYICELMLFSLWKNKSLRFENFVWFFLSNLNFIKN